MVWEGRSREAPPYPDCATALRVTTPAKKLGARSAQRLDALRAAIVRADEARAAQVADAWDALARHEPPRRATAGAGPRGRGATGRRAVACGSPPRAR